MAGKLRVTLVRSVVSHTARTRGTVRALGLHRIGETVEIADTPQMRGMTRAVRFLLSTEEIGAANETATKPVADEPQTPVAAKGPPPAPKATTKASAAADKPARARTSAKAPAAAEEPAATPAKAPARSRAKKEESQS